MIDLPLEHSRPGDTRGFIHKKILGGISAVAGIASSVGVPGAGAVARVSRAFAGGRRTPPRTTTARVTPLSQAEKNLGRNLKFGGPAPMGTAFRGGAAARRSLSTTAIPFPIDIPCPAPLVLAPDGHCVARGSGHFQLHFGRTEEGAQVPVGDAVLGLYGAGVTPGSQIVDRAVCPRKMQLGSDGICYNKAQISNKQRMWPAGRRPLLTGGDMRAISIASRAGTRMDGATKRLRKLGMMRQAPVARAKPKPPTVHEQIALTHALK